MSLASTTCSLPGITTPFTATDLPFSMVIVGDGGIAYEATSGGITVTVTIGQGGEGSFVITNGTWSINSDVIGVTGDQYGGSGTATNFLNVWTGTEQLFCDGPIDVGVSWTNNDSCVCSGPCGGGTLEGDIVVDFSTYFGPSDYDGTYTWALCTNQWNNFSCPDVGSVTYFDNGDGTFYLYIFPYGGGGFIQSDPIPFDELPCGDSGLVGCVEIWTMETFIGTISFGGASC
jgi:hypothetical protein